MSTAIETWVLKQLRKLRYLIRNIAATNKCTVPKGDLIDIGLIRFRFVLFKDLIYPTHKYAGSQEGAADILL